MYIVGHTPTNRCMEQVWNLTNWGHILPLKQTSYPCLISRRDKVKKKNFSYHDTHTNGSKTSSEKYHQKWLGDLKPNNAATAAKSLYPTIRIHNMSEYPGTYSQSD